MCFASHDQQNYRGESSVSEFSEGVLEAMTSRILVESGGLESGNTQRGKQRVG